jgi:D-alanine-D-alanine ligase
VTRIALVTGGSTPERDVALAGAAQVVQALRDRGHHLTVIDTTSGPLDPEAESRLLRPEVGPAPPTPEYLDDLAARELGPRLVDLPAMRDADLVFPVLHGEQGEGGALQALLEVACVPYVGSGPLGSALAMDKDVAKRLFRAADVPTADWVMWPAEDGAIRALGTPLIVKPVKVGSTVGLTLIHDWDAVPAAIREAAVFDDEIMLEAFLGGREFTVGVLGDRALAVGEIIPSHEIFDYECKYTPGLTQEIFPADLSPDITERLQMLALRAHRCLKLRDFSRIDFRLDDAGAPACLEANTLPGLTRTSLLPQSAAAAGVSFPELCETICELGLARSRSGNKLPS